MKKFVLIFLSVVMVLSLAACGTNGSKNNESATITATPAEIEQKIADAIGKDNYLCDTEADKNYLQNTLGLDLSEVDSYAAKLNSISSVNPDTVIILKVKGSYTDEAVKALNTSYAQMVDYLPAMIKNNSQATSMPLQNYRDY